MQRDGAQAGERWPTPQTTRRSGFWRCCLALGWVLGGSPCPSLAQTPAPQAAPPPLSVTNVLQLRQLMLSSRMTDCRVRFEGTILWASQVGNQLVIQDDSGAVSLNVDLRHQSLPQSGQRVLMEGRCLAGLRRLSDPTLLDNDGVHSALAMSKTFRLPQGRVPLRLEWFNQHAQSGLKVEWAGPQLPRQPVPGTVLFRSDPATANGTNRLAQGLDYRCYEGLWDKLPDFSQLPIQKQGTVTHFDLEVRTRTEAVGLVFEGFLEVPREGTYTFWLTSDDGSRLSVGPPAFQFQRLGPSPPLTPHRLVAGQAVPEALDCRWAQVEGTVTFVGEIPKASFLELYSSAGRTHLHLAQSSPLSLRHLLGCRIAATGVCQAGMTADQVPGFSLLVPNVHQLQILEFTPSHWVEYPAVSIAALSGTTATPAPDGLVHVSGIVRSNLAEQTLLLEDDTGRLLVQSAQPLPQVGRKIEVLGQWSGSASHRVLSDGFWQYPLQTSDGAAPPLPLLTQAAQVKRLNREEARRRYPVRLRGVITARLGRGFTIQDSTWSMFFRLGSHPILEPPRVGECWEIEGTTAMDFAPTILTENANYLGAGMLPPPLQPTWDELLNGSLDTQYIELQGVATSIGTNGLMVLTRGGKVWVELMDFNPQGLSELKDALIRIRGVNSPGRESGTLQIIRTRIRLFNPQVVIDSPAPPAPFETPLKRVSDLLYFDANANALRRIKLAGQVVHQWHGEYLLMDGTAGWRFQPKEPVQLEPGDRVEVVGFPTISGPSPVLREALARRVGTAALPGPAPLASNNLLNGKLDATRVRVQATVLDSSVAQSNVVLQLQAGHQGFVARLPKPNRPLADLKPGSRLELTGVYVGQGGDRMQSPNVESFELLLSSPADIRVLSHPSWWTAQHALTVVGSMVLVMAAGVVWIALLRRQVEERSQRLAEEIRSREQTEHQRVLEQERSRIAQDLHDDLGATLTQIGFLSAVRSCDAAVPEATREQLKQVSEKSRYMVSSLDEIVWAVNPANDSLRSLTAYLRHIAEEFFRTTTVRCRLDIDKALPTVPLTSEVRHNLCLAVKEALNNSARHAQATELWLRIHCQDQTLEIIVEDNGRGFTDLEKGVEQSGLANMRRRLEQIGGCFDCHTRLGSGTVCRLTWPLA